MAKTSVLKPILQELGLSIHKFESETKVPRGRIAKGFDSNTALSVDSITRIVARFPQINKDYLLTGKGEMFTTPRKPVKKEDDEIEIKGLSLEEMMVRAGRAHKSEQDVPHEGEMLKAYIKGRGLTVEDIVPDFGTSIQNFYIHLRKPVLSKAFRTQIEQILNIDFYRDVMGTSRKSIEERIETESYKTLMLELFTRLEKLEQNK